MSAFIDPFYAKMSPSMLETLIEALPSAIVMVNPTGNVVLVNAETERLFCYPRHELVGRSVENLLPHRFREHHPLYRAGVFEGPQKRRIGAGRRLVALRKDGTEFPVEIGLNPVATEDGTFVLCVVADISARLEADERVRLAMLAAPNGMLIIDRIGFITAANLAAEGMFGHDAGQLVGRSVDSLVPQYHRAAHEQQRQAFFETPVGRPMGAGRDLYAVRKNGEEFPVEVALGPLRLGDQQLVVASVVDISERKRTDRILADRTRELERSNYELDNFAYVASHDLKAPLRAIDNLSTWIEEDLADVLNESARRHISLMQGRVRRMENLLDSLLAYSRVGRADERLTDVDTAGLVQELFGMQPAQGFTLQLITELPSFRTPRTPLSQVFHNLIGNAVKHHNRPDGHLEIASRTLTDHYEFSVTDDGPGIERAHHESIFYMFQTLRPRDEVEGSGMGLAIAKKIVTSYGGSIRVDSAPGKGSTFYFTWPKRIATNC